VRSSVVSLLLDGECRDVQSDTVADIADALDIYIEMRVRAGVRIGHAGRPS
jgi:hypothetical protein